MRFSLASEHTKSEFNVSGVSWEEFTPQEMNLKMYDDISSDERKKVVRELGEGTWLYSTPDRVFSLNTQKHRIIYLVQFNLRQFSGHQALTEIKVWRDKTAPLTKGLGEHIFFDVILPQADFVLVDCPRTSYGRSFWELRIYDAFSRNLPVYLVGSEMKTKQRLNAAAMFQQLASLCWEEQGDFKAKKIAICHAALWD
jgi:hypothetical protein